MPAVTPAMGALVDQAEASLRDSLDACPPFLAYISGDGVYAARMVAIDALAALSEAWESSVEYRLDLVTARLLAWDRIASR